MSRYRTASHVFLLFLIGVVPGTRLSAQGQAAFLDYMDRFHVFDKGVFQQLDNLPPQSFQLGDGGVFYLASNGNLMEYKAGNIKVLDQSTPVAFKVTDHLLAYKLATALKVYEHGKMDVVCYNAGNWTVDDSLVAWVDEAQRTINVRYNGKVHQVADALANDPILSWRTGDNIVAWVTTIEHKLMVFYRGETYELTPQADEVPYEAGLDMVVFQDSQDNGFKVFLRGEVIDLEPIMPKSYKLGKGVLAYIDQTGNLKVLSGTKVYTAYTYEPQEYFVEDSLVIVKDRDRLKVFYDGELKELENYWPELWKVSWRSLAYVDVNRAVKIWSEGRTEMAIQRETFLNFDFIRGTLLLNMPNKKVKVWWNGQVYAH